MRLFKFTCCFILLCNNSFFGQSDSLITYVKRGIELHDQGLFEEAINTYSKALQIDEESSLTHYEIALSYISAGKYIEAEYHGRKVLELNSDHLLEGHIALGNALDLQKKSKEAIEVYEEGMKKFSHYMLFYNHAVACFDQNELDKAYDSAINAILDNSGHSSSHLVLSQVMEKKGSRVKAMLPLYFFLLIEPNSERASVEYQRLRNLLDYGVTREDPNKINVSVPMSDDDFGPAEMMISLIKSSENLEENQGKSDLDLFAYQNDKIFSILGEIKKENTGFWWDYYVTFFSDIAINNYSTTFSYYISLSSGDESISWLENNQDQLDKFSKWLSN
jgi:tetratricopeptide (TPR) repeat protein